MLIKRSFQSGPTDPDTNKHDGFRGLQMAGAGVILHPGLPGTFQFMSALLEGLLVILPLILKESWLE